MTDLDPRRERYAGAITEHLWGSPEDVDEATAAVMAIADQERRDAEAAIARVRALHRKATHGDDCVHCAAFGPGYDNTWPCQTIRVFDGTAPVPPTPVATDPAGPVVDRPFRSHRQQPAPAATEATGHRYLSTGCLHGHHDYCSNVDGIAGLKKPAQCKFCTAPCICPCHQTTEA